MNIHYALDLIEDQLGIYRTKRANATTRVNGVLASIKALQASLDARFVENDLLQDKYAADEHLIETLKVECGGNLADKQRLGAENERLHGSMDRIRRVVGRWLAEPDGPPTEEMIHVMDELEAFGQDA